MTIHPHDTEETILATVMGAGFSIITHPMSDAFMFGFIGALGGLTCKVLYNLFMKWYESKSKRRKS